MFKFKKVITVLAIIFLLMTLFVQVKATSDNPLTLNDLILDPGTNPDPDPIVGDDPNGIAANEEALNQETQFQETVANQEVANAEAANAEAGSVIQPDPDNDVEGNKLPQTGVTEDITVMFFIIVCVISAVYAYRKIRQYK